MGDVARARGNVWRDLRRGLLDAAWVTATAVVVALLVNALRPYPLPLVARAPYQTMVPCPEPGGPVTAVAADGPELAAHHVVFVDARAADEYATEHVSGALNLPYDWLDPLPEASLQALAREVAASGARWVVAYGDGGLPDSGEYLGREISARGIKNVRFVPGGAPALLSPEPP